MSPEQKSGPVAQELNREGRDCLTKLIQTVQEDGTAEAQRPPEKGWACRWRGPSISLRPKWSASGLKSRPNAGRPWQPLTV
jgi:hypothetical protein